MGKYCKLSKDGNYHRHLGGDEYTALSAGGYFILHFEQLKYLNNYPSIITLSKPWFYLSYLDVYNIVILSTAKKRFCQKKSGTDPVGVNPRSVTSMAEVGLQKSKIAKK